MAPAFDGAVGADPAGVPDSGIDCREAALRGARLPVVVVAPAFDGAVGADRAGVLVACAHRGERAGGGVGLAHILVLGVVVAAPALDGAAGADPARVERPGGHGGEGPLGPVDLPVVVVAPADDRPVGHQGARVVPARDHRGDGGGRFGAVLPGAFGVGVGAVGRGVGVVGVVGVGGGSGEFDESQGAGQERGHLGSRDGLVGAVAQRLAGAACGDAGRGQGVDVGLVEVGTGVGEPGRVGGRQVEGTSQERGHLGPVHRPVRAEPQRIDQAALRDLELGQTLEVGQPAVAGVHVGEARLRCGGRFGLVEDPHQPDRHRPALHLVAGAEHVLGALGAVEQAPLGQRINGRLVHAPSDVSKPASSLHGLGGRCVGGRGARGRGARGRGVRRRCAGGRCVGGVGGRHRRQPGDGDRNDYRHNPQPPDHGATLLNRDMPVRPPARRDIMIHCMHRKPRI